MKEEVMPESTQEFDLYSALNAIAESDCIRMAWEGFPFIIIDEHGKIVMASPLADKIFGYRVGELAATRKIEDLVPASYKAMHPEDRKTYASGSTARPMALGKSVKGICKDGSEVPVSISLYSKFIKSNQYFIACISLLSSTDANHHSHNPHLSPSRSKEQ